MFRPEFRETARRQPSKIAKRNPSIAKDIKDKILWLAANVENVEHEKMHGHAERSLHSRQYRILYTIDRLNEITIIEDVDKHDAAYRKLKRR